MGLRSVEILYFFQYGDRLYTSESDVYIRHILTSKDGPRTERDGILATHIAPTRLKENNKIFRPLKNVETFLCIVISKTWPRLMRSILRISDIPHTALHAQFIFLNVIKTL